MHINEALKHFEITDEEFTESKAVCKCTNGQFYREKTGVEHTIGKYEEDHEKVKGKVRIIIDYDTDFPEIVTRLIFR